MQQQPLKSDSSVKPKLINPIEEFVKNNVGENAFRDLFDSTPENVIRRSHFTELEVDCINKILVNNDFLISCFGKDLGDVYGPFLLSYMNSKISFNRGSRMEFVDVNRKERFKQNLQEFGAFAGISKVKE